MSPCQYITILQLFGDDICAPSDWEAERNFQAANKVPSPHNFLAWHCWQFFRSPALLYPSSAMFRAVTLVVFSGTIFSCVRQLAQGKHDTTVTFQWLKWGFFLLTFRNSVAVALMVGVFGSVRDRIHGAKYLLSWVDQYTTHFLPIYEVRKIFCFLQIDKMQTQGVCWDINKRVDWLWSDLSFSL